MSVIAAAVTALPIAVAATGPAWAHGSLETPISRSYVCYQEGPESPVSDACAAVVAAGGTQPLYDWMEVNIADATGRHREIIPDGELCSAGRAKYRGLDLARKDWPATSLTPGAQRTFRYRATAPHQGGFELYITRDGYDPAEPLAWDDLEPEPFHVESSPSLVDGHYPMDVTLPQKEGRHLIYAIWQRTDSPEAFYACSDVVFGGATGETDEAAPDEPAPGEAGSGEADSAGDDTGGAGARQDTSTGSDSAAGDPDGADSQAGGGEDDPACGTAGGHGSSSEDQAGPDHHDADAGWTEALIDWLTRLEAWAEASPGHADDTVLRSSAVSAGDPSSDTGDATPQVALGAVAVAILLALVLARPLGRGRHRWQPAHRR